MKRYLASLAIREIQIKTTLRFHLTPVRMAFIKKANHNQCWGRCRMKGFLIHCWWECNYYSHYGNQYGSFSENLKIQLP
jgi:hypothetical protein